MSHTTLTSQESLIVLFSGVADLPGASPVVVCKVEPLGTHPILRITWDSLERKWQTEVICEKEQHGQGKVDSVLPAGGIDLGGHGLLGDGGTVG